MFSKNIVESRPEMDITEGEEGVPTSYDAPDLHSASEEYANRFKGSTGDWLLEIQEGILSSFLNQISTRPLKILDVGGGHGQVLKMFFGKHRELNLEASDSVDYTLFGSSNASLERVVSLYGESSYKIVTGDLLALPFQDNNFDVVISIRILSHMRDWKKFMKELARVSRNAVVVDYPVKKSANFLTPLLFKLKRGLEGNTRTYTVFDESEIIQEFKLHNFEVKDREAQFFFPMVFHRVLRLPGLSKLVEKFALWSGLTRSFGSPVLGYFGKK